MFPTVDSTGHRQTWRTASETEKLNFYLIAIFKNAMHFIYLILLEYS